MPRVNRKYYISSFLHIMVFNVYDYKKIFIRLHEEYFDKYLKREKQLKTYQEVIEEFKKRDYKKEGLETRPLIPLICHFF